jgi:hypothetical protein
LNSTQSGHAFNEENLNPFLLKQISFSGMIIIDIAGSFPLVKGDL